ncbi:MAG: right-handed parallel beta-helix repeat-containing protein [Candidatus Thorarchaeota archaeon]
MVDPIVNKGKVTVSTGYNSTATSIVLATGQGAELPDPVVDGPYNLPWWDSTNYNDPADDPNFEIVRVTGPAGTGDTKTIVRAQEGTAATAKNNADAVYKMHLGVTAKTITDLIADVEKCATVIVGKSGHVDYLTTDYGSDDACIQAAIDYVDGLGGGSVLIREGSYSIDDTIILKENMIVTGTGWGTILKNINDTTYLIQLENGTAIDERLIHSSLQNICLDGDKGSNTTGSGIYSEYTQEFNLHNVLFHDFDNNGMYLQTCKKFTISQCLFGGTGKAISGTQLRLSTCGDVEIVGNNFHDFSTDALRLTADTEKTNVVGNGFYSGVDAIKMGTVSGTEAYNTIANNNFANCTGYGIVCDQTIAAGNNIVSNTFRTIGKNAISVRGHYWDISGNYIYNPANENVGGDNNLGIRLRDGAHNCIISNNRVIADNGFMTYAIGSTGGSGDYNMWVNNPLLSGYSSAAIRKEGSNSILQNNHNVNPAGNFTPPSVPATTVNYTNSYGYSCQVQVYGGTVTEIDIDDIATGLTSGIFMIPPGGTINITYSAAPSWRWWGL